MGLTAVPLPDLSDAILYPEDVTPSPPPNCCRCGRYVNVKTAHRHLEMGDYGTVLSCEFECPHHAASDQEGT